MINMFKKEMRICNECGLILKSGKDLKRHADIVGHTSFSIVKMSEEEIFRRISQIEGRVKRLEDLVQKLALRKKKEEGV